MRYLAPLLVVLLLGAVSAPGAADAQPVNPRQGVQSGQVRSLGEILDNVRRQHPGNLADVQGPNIGPSGDPRYRLKWVTPDGRVQWLDTDARTGRVLRAEGAVGPPRVAGPPRGAFVPRRPLLSPFGRGAGFGRGPGPGPGFGRGPGPGIGRGPFGRGPVPGNRFRPGR